MAARLVQRPQRVAGAAAQRERERAGAREREGERLGPRRAQLREDARELAELGGERVAAPRRQRRARVLRRLAPVRRRRGGVGSARRIKLPNAMLQAMVDNLKAEVYETRLRLISRGSGIVESDSSGESSTHREEELHEGDIQGSFAEGRL